ncbi:MAG: hypothetical protein KDA99_05135, partial [Planctomycetales bacterium]|nr:hypothetical protein [Planctomycetales bacterium]
MSTLLGAATIVVFLLVWAMTGHLLWVLGRLVVRAIAGDTDRWADSVPASPFEPARSTASDTKRLEELSRQVQQLCDAGAVSMDACDRMQALLRREIAAQSPAVISPVPPAPAAASDDTPRSTRTFACNTAASPSTEDNNFVTAELVTTVAADDTAAPVVVRSWKDVLRSFMEERNIRWGEIISGILIVGCAIGLVISLWATLRDTIPYFPAMIFALFTSALYGAGYYTMRRWRLTSTSRGLLVIALLLIPLNFLAGIALRGPGHPLDLLSWLAMGIGLALFSWMSYSASRLLLAECPWQLALATMGPALAQLVVSRVGVDELNTVSTTLLTLLISAGVLVSLGATVWQTRSRSHMSASTAWHLLAVTGLGFFSATISFGLLLHVNPHRAFVLAASSPAVSLVAMMVVTVGIALHVRCREPSTATFRMAGTATALLGGIFAVRNVVCAWPHPEFLVAVGLICFVCLTLLAVVGRLPTLHGPALVCGVIAYLIVVYLIRGDLSTPSDRLASTMLQLAGRGVTAVALMFASFVLGGTVSVWKRFPKIGATAPYATAGMVTGTGSLIIAIYATLASHTPRSLGVIGLAPHDADYATLIFFTYAALAFGLGWVRNNKWSVAIASVLLLMAWEHAFLANTTVLRLAPFIDHIFRPAAAALVANSLCLSVTAAVHHRWLSLRTESGVASTGETAACGNVSRIAISISLWRLSLVAIGLATCCVVAPSMQGFRYQSLYLTVLSLSWFIIGWGTRRKLATAGIQWSVSLASGYYLAHAGTGTWWRLPETGGWLFLWATSLLAAAWVPVWVLTRRLLLQATRRTDGTGTWHELIQPHAWSTERILALSTVAVTSILSIHYTVHFDDSPVSNIQLWVLWLATLSATVLSSGRRWNEHSIAALTVLFGTMPLLAGVPFSSQWTLLGALAWTFATATLFGAFAEWNRSAIDKLLSRFGIAVNPFDDDTRWALRAAIVTFTYVPAFALVMINIGRHVPLLATITLAPPLLENRWLDALYWSGPLSVVGASTLGHAIRGTNSRMLFLGGVVFQIFACTLSLIAFPPPSVPWTGDVPVRCLQVVTISSAIFLLLWVALYPSMVRRRTAVSLDSNIELAAQDDTFWFYTQTTLVLSCIVLLTLLSFSAVLFPRMIAANGTTASMIVQLSHPAGWWAWAFTVLGFLVSAGRLPSRVTLHHFLFVGLQCIGLIASFQASSPSLRIVTLLWGVVALALCCTALASLPKLSTSRKDDVFEPTTFGRNANIWVYVLGVFGVVVAFRAAVEGATETCIASHAVGVIAIAFFTHGMLGNHRTALALSYATGVVGGLFAWLGYKLDPWISLVDLELGVLSAIGIAWSVYRIVMERSGRAAGRDVGSVLDAWVAGSTTTILLMRSVLLFTIHGLSKA